ncbi:hypothetical protein JOB18_018480 [Solea senegalensis]|uniref:Uncharacterized protein n=1 Tax=Solea senegalensis TaxID=28829 RepID=A0AAV6PYD0_SOLSE|nr:hypothetical protein JOB18_018480 [Solea senegalensis]
MLLPALKRLDHAIHAELELLTLPGPFHLTLRMIWRAYAVQFMDNLIGLTRPELRNPGPSEELPAAVYWTFTSLSPISPGSFTQTSDREESHVLKVQKNKYTANTVDAFPPIADIFTCKMMGLRGFSPPPLIYRDYRFSKINCSSRGGLVRANDVITELQIASQIINCSTHILQGTIVITPPRRRWGDDNSPRLDGKTTGRVHAQIQTQEGAEETDTGSYHGPCPSSMTAVTQIS